MKINRYLEIEKQFDKKNILVVGDVMLDNYLWGDVKRISPEAPVPIVDINESNSNPGGAANVASNLKSLGANVTIAGVVGDDRDGNTLRELLKVMNIDTVFLQTDLSLSTTVKTRIMARGQQVIRADWESSSGMISENRLALLDQFKNDIKQFDGVILADYDKGLFDSDMISSLIEMCRTKDIPIFVEKYYLLKKFPDKIIGGFFWRKGRPNIIFFRQNLYKFGLHPTKELEPYIEDKL